MRTDGQSGGALPVCALNSIARRHCCNGVLVAIQGWRLQRGIGHSLIDQGACLHVIAENSPRTERQAMKTLRTSGQANGARRLLAENTSADQDQAPQPH